MLKKQFVFVYTLILLYFFIFSCIHAIEVDNLEFNFGRVKAGTILNYSISIKNTLNTPLNLGLRPTCDCVTASPERFTIKEKAFAQVKIKIDTTGYNSPFEEKIFIQSNDPDKPYIPVLLKGSIYGVSPNENHQNILAPTVSTTTVHITIFDSKGCLFCLKMKNEIFPIYEKKYSIKISVDDYSVDVPENFEKLLAMEEKTGKTLNKIPVIFIGNDIIGGKKEILESLPSLISKYAAAGGCPKIEISNKPVKSAKTTNKIEIIPVAAAGFIDSLNPCAFATIVFLISYLGMVLKKSKREIFFAGISFISGVFITYLLIGMGMFRFMHKINGIVFLSKAMYFIVGLIALLVSIQSLREANAIKRGKEIKPGSIKLGLPKFLRWEIYEIITKLSVFKYIIPIAFILGAIITVLELLCTGQVYLPTIMYMVKMRDYQLRGTLYLLFYCIIFVLPLITVFLFYYFGISIERIETAFRKRMFTIKIMVSVFLFALSIIIFKNLFLT